MRMRQGYGMCLRANEVVWAIFVWELDLVMIVPFCIRSVWEEAHVSVVSMHSLVPGHWITSLHGKCSPIFDTVCSVM